MGRYLLPVFLLWFFVHLAYVLVEADDCSRIRRSTAPMRGTLDLIGKGMYNWISPTERLEYLLWSMEADLSTQRVLRYHFYGERLTCGWLDKAAK